MKKNLLLLLVVCLLGTGFGYAQIQKNAKLKGKKAELALKKAFEEKQTLKRMPAFKLQPAATPKFAAPAEGSVLVSEDFSKFTAGSEATPDNTDVCDSQTGAISSSYVQTPGWWGQAIYQAGGCAYVGTYTYYEEEMTGFINSPDLDLTGNDGVCTVYFRAKSTNPDGDEMIVMSGSTSAVSSGSVAITNNWADYSVVLGNGEEGYSIQMYADLYPYYLDDIRVVVEGMRAPENLRCSAYDGTSATIAWDAVEGADSYTVNVYWANYDLMQYEEQETGISVAGTSYNLTGLSADREYYFNVTAVKDGKPGAESALAEISMAGPVALPCSNFSKTSFTANWEALDIADSYLLSVYTKEFNYSTYGYDYEYLLENQPVSGTSYDVTGAVFGEAYYYSVVAKVGNGYTKASDEIAVYPESVAAPTANDVENVGRGSFTGSWTESANANLYMPSVIKEHTAQAAETFYLFNSDFSTATSTEGTLETPEQLYGSIYLDDYTEYGGWGILYGALANGAIGIDNANIYSLLTGATSYLLSPSYDLSGVGGEVKVSFQALGVNSSGETTNGILALVTEDSEGYLNTVSTPVQFTLSADMAEYSYTLNGGTSDCYVILYTTDFAVIMLDDLKVSVDLEKDGKFTIPMAAPILQSTRYDFEGYSVNAGDRFAYNVTACYSVGNADAVMSEVSNTVWFELQSSVSDAIATEEAAKVYVAGGVLRVENPDGGQVAVYNTNGAQLFVENTGAATTEFELPAAGVYVVRVGNEVFKVVK